MRAAIVSRIKIMAKLNIAERRLPQDGRIKLAVRGTPIDLRISTIPTLYGESVVMRVLDRESVTLDFGALGIEGTNLSTFLDVLERPNGIFLVTGPTGSGKTTTLYAALSRLNQPDRKIITVEDPIEYQLEGVNQIQVKPAIGLDFANVLRAILRQDPDIILIGEIRDLETAQIAAQAALTGHLVLSTLHTNNAASSISRLLDMGVEDYLVTATVNGVAAQRLVRRLCPHCREAYPVEDELFDHLGLARYGARPGASLYRPKGCGKCGDSGYRGRMSILETLVLNDDLRRATLQSNDSRALHRQAVEGGMRTLYDDGMDKALAGETSVEEVLRATRDA
jgi:general secretion pathway protein E